MNSAEPGTGCFCENHVYLVVLKKLWRSRRVW